MNKKQLQEKNPGLSIFSVESPEFTPFGRIIEGIDVTDSIDFVEKQTQIPNVANIYEASIPELEQMKSSYEIAKVIYGYSEIQVGICNGNTHQLNALEYHKCSEINIAVTDMVLLLGQFSDIEDGVYDSAKIQGFYIPKGVAVELYAQVLHFAPCSVSPEGFKSIVILTKGTNADIEAPNGTLFKVNKWLYTHESTERFVTQGAHIGIKGTNILLQY